MKKIMLVIILLVSSLKADLFSGLEGEIKGDLASLENTLKGQGKEQAGCLKEWIINDTENVLTGLKNCSYTNNLIGDALQSSDPINYLKNNAEHVGIKLAKNYTGWSNSNNKPCNDLINSYLNWSKRNRTGACKHTLQGSGKTGSDITTGIQWVESHGGRQTVSTAKKVYDGAKRDAKKAWHKLKSWF